MISLFYTYSFCWLFFFFFKQKTAYEMLRSLVGSEMCIRDRSSSQPWAASRARTSWVICWGPVGLGECTRPHAPRMGAPSQSRLCCLLYTSDAADEEDSVDLGGRRIIKKKKTHK
eukprot:TRINITY_DN18426_c0_g1_i2.p2 TRINITY_DN18426_c0_g1~~TRINITY_DN18426_c0_g1_i2.p2  ORF type:complete len:115 (+),score=29.79 TRINITY_DN18426_c0_g1_i2:100-444(+)